MRYVAAFVDAGFLKAAGATALGQKTSQVRPDARAVVEYFRNSLEPDERILRVYWYDGAYEPNHQQYGSQRSYFDAIAFTPGIQLRLGHIQESKPRWHSAVKGAIKSTCETLGYDGDGFMQEFQKNFSFRRESQQKGVDTRIVLDLVRLGQSGAYDTALLMTGDRDIAEAVYAAQDAGRRIVLATPGDANVAAEMRQAVDDHLYLTATELQTMLLPRP